MRKRTTRVSPVAAEGGTGGSEGVSAAEQCEEKAIETAGDREKWKKIRRRNVPKPSVGTFQNIEEEEEMSSRFRPFHSCYDTFG